MTRTEEIKARLGAASVDWNLVSLGTGKKIDLTPDEDGYVFIPEDVMFGDTCLIFNGEPESRADDARFLENAPSDIRYLLDRCEALEAANEKMRESLDRALKGHREGGTIGDMVGWTHDARNLVRAALSSGEGK